MGPRMRQMLATICVTSSLFLVALRDFDLTGRFHLGTLSFAGPLVIVRPILDMVAISHDVEGASCVELGWRINSCLLCFFTTPAKARHFASLVVTPQEYKADGRSCTKPMSSHMISHCLPVSFPMANKKER
jgi:hypothetical protein